MPKGEHITTTDGQPAHPEFDLPESPAPQPVDPSTGQHGAYWVLDEEECAKGFVRPVRRSYRHVGPPPPRYQLRDLTEDEQQRYADAGYVKYETYPTSEAALGRFWTQEQLDNHGCGTVTIMGQALAETYARNPGFYGSTFCCRCGTHLLVGRDGEFVWDDGSGERVGS